jgi:nucleoside-diphosphate-sugar epimerase
MQLAERGVRSVVVRLPPTVHGEGDHGFVAVLVSIAREKGVSGYVGDGTNRWSAVHRSDAAHLFRLALERATPGSVLAATADDGVPVREIAEIIGRHLDVSTASIAPDDSAAHFGWLGGFLALDTAAASHQTQELLGWQPTGPGSSRISSRATTSTLADATRQPVGPKRSTRMFPTGIPDPMAISVAASQKPGEPHT